MSSMRTCLFGEWTQICGVLDVSAEAAATPETNTAITRTDSSRCFMFVTISSCESHLFIFRPQKQQEGPHFLRHRHLGSLEVRPAFCGATRAPSALLPPVRHAAPGARTPTHPGE